MPDNQHVVQKNLNISIGIGAGADQEETLREMMKITRHTESKQFFSEMLNGMLLIIEEVRSGRAIVSIDETRKKWRPLEIRFLKNIRGKDSTK